MKVTSDRIALKDSVLPGRVLPSPPAAPSDPLTIQLIFRVKYSRWRRSLPCINVHIGQKVLSFSLHRHHEQVALTFPLKPEEFELPLRFSFKGNVPLDAYADATVISQPKLDDGPIMIVAPHPDDAEIAAGGLYSVHAAQTRIVTLSAGELLRKLDRQYITRLDDDLTTASQRKGDIRSWNSAVTPLLSGVAIEHCQMLGVPDGYGWQIIHDDAVIDPVLPIQQARRLNALSLPNDNAEILEREHIINDLQHLIEHWQPATILVTDPEYDPHPDHLAASLALAEALKRSHSRPERVLLYANHYQDAHPPGPAFQPAWTPSPALRKPLFRAPAPYLFSLDEKAQRHKALLLDAMDDLSRRDRPRQIRKKNRREGFHPTFAPDRDRYFQWAIRSSEYFQMVDVEEFIEGTEELLPDRSPGRGLK